ncbi:MAG: hypothetical protein ACN4GZ_08790 [Acidimicrobiales bacterium]
MTHKTKMVEKKSYEHQPTDSETPRWTLWGHSVLPTTVEGRLAVLFTVLWPLWPIPVLALTAFGAPIFLFLGVRKGDRGLLLVLPVLASILLSIFVISLTALTVWEALFGWMPTW